MSASSSGTWLQRHPLLAVVITYAAFFALTFACIASPRVFSDHLVLLGLPLFGAATIGGVLYHIRSSMPATKIERFGRIFGGTVILLLVWFVVVWLYVITHAAASL